MKRIFTIKNGLLIFLIVLFSVILLTTICTTFGIMALPKIEGIMLCISNVLYIIVLVVFFKLHYLNYIVISSNGVAHKNKFYSWDEVCLTMDYTVPNLTRNAYNYRVYFSNSYYYTHEEIKQADKEAFCIDLNDKRIALLFQYYLKKVNIIKESPMQEKILKTVIEHNNKNI